ncbi:MAG: hypothetical protein AAFN76_12725, partial [Pseudomonadota bacterium]
NRRSGRHQEGGGKTPLTLRIATVGCGYLCGMSIVGYDVDEKPTAKAVGHNLSRIRCVDTFKAS